MARKNNFLFENKLGRAKTEQIWAFSNIEERGYLVCKHKSKC